MTKIEKSALLPFPAEALFELVSDIESYPQYMDGCASSAILHRATEFVDARLDLSRAGIQQSFSTRNRLQPPNEDNHSASISMELLDGPFSSLRGQWTFQALRADACKIVLDLSFELDSSLKRLAFGKLFESVASNLVEAVCRRAHTVCVTS